MGLSAFINQLNHWVSEGNGRIFCSVSKDVTELLHYLKRKDYIQSFCVVDPDSGFIVLYPGRRYRIKLLKRKYYTNQELVGKYERENKPTDLVFSTSEFGLVSYHEIVSSQQYGGLCLFKIETYFVDNYW